MSLLRDVYGDVTLRLPAVISGACSRTFSMRRSLRVAAGMMTGVRKRTDRIRPFNQKFTIVFALALPAEPSDVSARNECLVIG